MSWWDKFKELAGKSYLNSGVPLGAGVSSPYDEHTLGETMTDLKLDEHAKKPNDYTKGEIDPIWKDEKGNPILDNKGHVQLSQEAIKNRKSFDDANRLMSIYKNRRDYFVENPLGKPDPNNPKWYDSARKVFNVPLSWLGFGNIPGALYYTPNMQRQLRRQGIALKKDPTLLVHDEATPENANRNATLAYVANALRDPNHPKHQAISNYFKTNYHPDEYYKAMKGELSVQTLVDFITSGFAAETIATLGHSAPVTAMAKPIIGRVVPKLIAKTTAKNITDKALDKAALDFEKRLASKGAIGLMGNAARTTAKTLGTVAQGATIAALGKSMYDSLTDKNDIEPSTTQQVAPATSQPATQQADQPATQPITQQPAKQPKDQSWYDTFSQWLNKNPGVAYAVPAILGGGLGGAFFKNPFMQILGTLGGAGLGGLAVYAIRNPDFMNKVRDAWNNTWNNKK